MNIKVEAISEVLVKVHFTSKSISLVPSWSFPWLRLVMTEMRSTRVAEQLKPPFFNWTDSGYEIRHATNDAVFTKILAEVERFKYLTSRRALIQTTSDI